LKRHGWQEERRFWQQQILPLVATSYWRSIDENGRPTDHFWRYDLMLFQSVFALDILLRMLRLRRRFPGIRWRDALLRRWIDLPLLLPFWRWLRIAPVVERLSQAGLIDVEPLRAVISRGVVSLLALELFEVLALQLVDGTQSLIRSPQWPRMIRGLRSHQSVSAPSPQAEQPLLGLVRLWGPMVLGQVTPRLTPELQSLLGHALEQSLREVPGAAVVPAVVARQLSAGMVDSLVELSRGTAERLAESDERQCCTAATFWRSLLGGAGRGPGAWRHPRALPVAALRPAAAAQAQLPRPDEPCGDRGSDGGARSAHSPGEPYARAASHSSCLKPTSGAPRGGDGKGPFDQLPIGRQGPKSLGVIHGFDRLRPQGAVALPTGVEQAFAPEVFQRELQFPQGWVVSW